MRSMRRSGARDEHALCRSALQGATGRLRGLRSRPEGRSYRTTGMSLAWHTPGTAALADVDIALAQVLRRRWPDASDESLRAVALASWAVQQGHTCLDFE